jgi:hypothetical protein
MNAASGKEKKRARFEDVDEEAEKPKQEPVAEVTEKEPEKKKETVMEQLRRLVSEKKAEEKAIVDSRYRQVESIPEEESFEQMMGDPRFWRNM